MSVLKAEKENQMQENTYTKAYCNSSKKAVGALWSRFAAYF